jgi:hypothetical protein
MSSSLLEKHNFFSIISPNIRVYFYNSQRQVTLLNV